MNYSNILSVYFMYYGQVTISRLWVKLNEASLEKPVDATWV